MAQHDVISSSLRFVVERGNEFQLDSLPRIKTNKKYQVDGRYHLIYSPPLVVVISLNCCLLKQISAIVQDRVLGHWTLSLPNHLTPCRLSQARHCNNLKCVILWEIYCAASQPVIDGSTVIKSSAPLLPWQVVVIIRFVHSEFFPATLPPPATSAIKLPGRLIKDQVCSNGRRRRGQGSTTQRGNLSNL